MVSDFPWMIRIFGRGVGEFGVEVGGGYFLSPWFFRPVRLGMYLGESCSWLTDSPHRSSNPQPVKTKQKTRSFVER